MKYADEEKHISGMPTYAFSIVDYDYDTTIPLNKGSAWPANPIPPPPPLP